MQTAPSLAYLLLYAANIDTHIRLSEKELILKKIDSFAAWQEAKTSFESDTDFERTEKVTSMLQNATEEEKSKLLAQVKKVLHADDDFSTVERYFLNILKRF